MSSKSKHKVKLSLKITPCVDCGFNRAVREELGVNISNPSSPGDMLKTVLQKEIKLLFDMADVAKSCPDTKRMVHDPSGTGKHVPVRYRLGAIKTLHWQFEAETGTVCSLEWFCQNISFDVVHPKPNDWGTCLCAQCINPRMKLDALADLVKDPSLRWNDGDCCQWSSFHAMLEKAIGY